ncbi:fibronectin type III domain-containing protein, partial [uncultured Ilumatobacter sp.]|uniref:RCC1 domain-containing protein n=1 Tax=uncultured Ilumatobacter sp. TaxID=879968 RepID=UPI00374FC0F1
MLSLARVRRLVVVVAAGALVVASVGSSVPVLALSDGSQSPEIAVEQAEIGTGNSFGVEGPVVAGVSGNFASVLAPKTASVFNPSNTFGTGVTPQIAAGGYHTCALLNTGAVNCWGRNFYGQLGDGTTTDSSAPVAVATFTDGSATAVSITAGSNHTCALLNTGAVNCWGQNNSGQLGDGNDTNTDSSVPVAVAAFTVGSATAVSITAGDFHTCALLNTGAVNCWGYNGFGQLGNNTNTDSSASVAVAAFTDVSATAVSITAGSNHTCAVLNTGAVNCWGNNGNGQLGNNTNGSSSRSAPVAVSAFTDVSATAVSITAGNSHTCVVLNTGAVNCWGWNNFGQLGNNTNASSFVPVAVATFTVGSATAVSITAGFGHTCALLSTGAVNCWGYNSFGGLGNNTNASSFVPVAVAAFTVGSATAVSITADAFHTCALLSTGAVNCWGFNGNGQLGNGTTTDSSVPVAVSAFTVGSATAVSITAGYFHTCALLNTGAVNCWGQNNSGELGNGTTTSSSAPVAVSAFTDGATAVSITAGSSHTCALLNTGAVNCWGSNDDGQLGNNTTTSSLVPVAVAAFTVGSATAVSITAGRYHTCALLNTGAVNCWGWNIFGQLGNGTTTSSLVPVAVSAFTVGSATAVSITAGDYHTCALLNTGAVNCWGQNGSGQLGNGTTTSSSGPVAVAAFTVGSATAVSITAGLYHTCALLNTGAVNCWGQNSFGGLGNDTTTSSSVPVAVAAFTDVTATAVSITASLDHTCALLNTGAVNCWGRNFYGQLGNNTNTDSSAPVAVAAFTVGSATAVSITAGYFHTCALLNTGAVNCWGYNSDGRLGNGTTVDSSVPAKVMLFVPGVPTGVSGVAGDSEVVVSWTAPVSDGGSVISSYTVTSSPHNKTCTTTGALTCTVAGLTNATAYTFTVAATNTAGAGPASTASGAATPVTVPGVPTGVSGVAGDSEVIVSWTAPISDGGSVISSYTVTSSPHNKTCTTTGALTCTVAGLTNATA